MKNNFFCFKNTFKICSFEKNLLKYYKMGFTFAMIKPDAVKNGHIGAILKIITDQGFVIKAMEMKQLSVYEAKSFYAIHQKQVFFDELIDFITSGPIVALVLSKKNAVESFRTLIGATNPEKAASGTIRKLFAKSIDENAIHGSDSNENAIIETNFHFAQANIFEI